MTPLLYCCFTKVYTYNMALCLNSMMGVLAGLQGLCCEVYLPACRDSALQNSAAADVYCKGALTHSFVLNTGRWMGLHR